jgi:DNA polymerase V
MKKSLISSASTETKNPLPLFASKVKAGFPSPADDFIEKPLDLNDLVIKHKAATFFIKVEGTSMEDAFIFEGDILVIDRAQKPLNKSIVLAIINGEFTVKRLLQKKEGIFLVAEKKGFKPIVITSSMDFEIWGVVTYIIHKAK